jgi:DNA-binding CsgD family transcriptional regulator
MDRDRDVTPQHAYQQRIASIDARPTILTRLTRREREVLALLVVRYTDREIAESLFLSYRTVTTHVASIRRKLGAKSRREAVAVAARHGLV